MIRHLPSNLGLLETLWDAVGFRPLPRRCDFIACVTERERPWGTGVVIQTYSVIVGSIEWALANGICLPITTSYTPFTSFSEATMKKERLADAQGHVQWVLSGSIDGVIDDRTASSSLSHGNSPLFCALFIMLYTDG